MKVRIDIRGEWPTPEFSLLIKIIAQALNSVIVSAKMMSKVLQEAGMILLRPCMIGKQKESGDGDQRDSCDLRFFAHVDNIIPVAVHKTIVLLQSRADSRTLT